ncbi:MAG: NAD(P)-dependent glycerol-1-phosphate dehydrogenase [Sulfolobales archaeon]|nr:NAD(P)-dependent glycerol-1-phosphate dehydrogenase [Sulfolobales archaeon]MDW8083066.1 NAD(P)-dependent glycerol-1-phosphate dehydrogenase [Sulfolobales archaeon]
MKHSIDLFKKVVIGYGVRWELGDLIKELGISGRLAVVTGPKVRRLVVEQVIERALDGFSVDVFEVEQPTVEVAESVSDLINSQKPSLIVAVGGGKDIDVAKYVSRRIGAHYVSVPTVTSHDGVASPFTSLRGMETVYSVRTSPPIAVLADIEVMASAPRRLAIAGAGDLISKITAVRDWRLAHRLKGEYYGDYAASLALMSARHVFTFSKTIARLTSEGLRILAEGLISSSTAICIAGSTRPASGSEHLFSHALDIVASHPALHGEQVGLGTIVMSYIHGINWRRIKKTLKKLGLPTTARELGVRDEHVIEALTIAHKIRPDRYTILGESGLTRDAAEEVANKTGVIANDSEDLSE